LAGQPIGVGNTVVGYIHGSNDADSNVMFPNWIKDNVGNIYTMAAPKEWIPWHEYITIFYLTNVQGSPTSFTIDFSNYPASGNTILGPCDIGFAEYSNVSNVAPTGPNLVYGATASLQVSPTATARIWAYASPFATGSSAALAASLQNSGYSFILDDYAHNDMGAWQSDALVPSGTITLTWNAPDGAPGTCPGIGGGENGCPTMVAAVTLQ
jgi:hypothetical protein